MNSLTWVAVNGAPRRAEFPNWFVGVLVLLFVLLLSWRTPDGTPAGGA